MKFKFEDLYVGDMFNTKAARWVKINSKEAICCVSDSPYFEIGCIENFEDNESTLIVLYSTLL
jgi:hypothetical protein